MTALYYHHSRVEMSASVVRCNSVEVSDQMIAVMFVKNYRSLELCVKGQELVH